VISVKPQVRIAKVGRAAATGKITIRGNGFGGYAEGSGTSVTGTVIGAGGGTETVEAAVVSWSDTAIEVDFGAETVPEAVTVNSVFGSDSSQVARGKRGRGKRK
jgi:hypothetical protein